MKKLKSLDKFKESWYNCYIKFTDSKEKGYDKKNFGFYSVYFNDGGNDHRL